MAPISSNGSAVIYNRIIKPFVVKHQGEIDSVLDEATSEATKVAGKAMDTGKETPSVLNSSTCLLILSLTNRILCILYKSEIQCVTA